MHKNKNLVAKHSTALQQDFTIIVQQPLNQHKKDIIAANDDLGDDYVPDHIL
ncbi:MAG TPA: hypothetical protein VFC67_25525 [Prolixibacteraceae bacterium]|nr:hypothetical protein [Prolixibacteraceae bacterium]